jgi:hypothetical protein
MHAFSIHRTFRKDPQTLHGYVTLAILEKLFRKHGNVLSDTCVEQIKDLYAVGLDEAAPILKVRVRAIDQLPHPLHCSDMRSFPHTTAEQELAHLGTEHLYEGLDQKVRPKARHSNAAMAAAQSRSISSVHATNRLKNNLIG